jgi:hypothetical protein
MAIDRIPDVKFFLALDENMKSNYVRRYTTVALVGVALLAVPQAATAAPGSDKVVVTVVGPPDDLLPDPLPAGQACPDFDLKVVGTNSQTHTVEYRKNGKLVRTIESGMGYDLTYTNLNTGKSVVYKSDFLVTDSVYHGNGIRTVTSTGYFGIIMFPTDRPPGPSTTQYVGRVVYKATQNNDFTIKSVRAQKTDVCAQLRNKK